MKPGQFLIALAAMSGVMYPTIAPASGFQTGAPSGALAGRPQPSTPIPAPEATAVVAFWREAGPDLWFAKNDEFDRRFRERFMWLYEAAARGELGGWSATADGALALVLLLDQFPRNASPLLNNSSVACALPRVCPRYSNATKCQKLLVSHDIGMPELGLVV